MEMGDTFKHFRAGKIFNWMITGEVLIENAFSEFWRISKAH